MSTSENVTGLRDLTPQQWKSGIAAWLGWLFDGLDMHLYVLVAAPFVAELLGASSAKDPAVGFTSSWIQAAFLIGWALGGGSTSLGGGINPARSIFSTLAKAWRLSATAVSSLYLLSKRPPAGLSPVWQS